MSVITLELPETLLRNIKAQAKQAKVSVEQYIVFTLSLQSTPAYKVKTATAKEIREQELKFAALRQSLGKPNLEATKKVLRKREQIEPESDLDSQTVKLLQSKFKT
jgi:hypothetical protein